MIIGGFLKHQVVEAHSFVANFATIEPVGHPWSRWFLIELGHPLQMAQQTIKNKSTFVPSKVFELKFAFDFLDDLFKNTTASRGCLCFFHFQQHEDTQWQTFQLGSSSWSESLAGASQNIVDLWRVNFFMVV